MEQLKANQHLNTPPSIRVKVQSGVNNSVEFQSSGIESYEACNTIEYLAQSSLKASRELEQMHCRNSALFIVCTTLILMSLASAVGFTTLRYYTTIIHSSPRYENSNCSDRLGSHPWLSFLRLELFPGKRNGVTSPQRCGDCSRSFRNSGVRRWF